jgi:2-polyprenyl-6-methoxyphenol hydroxylase-like FAD-dependent oxidoreductase
MFDAIVVGARCAGSPTAMLLARHGYRVLLVDRATFPSDTISTHYIWQQGTACLKRWGLLDRVLATNCPPFRMLGLDLGAFQLIGDTPEVDGATEICVPRRTVLDKILLDAASDAGVEAREGFTVTRLMSADGHVTGIRGHGGDGAEVEEQARVVIGADGRNSPVAAAVGAAEYNVRPALTCGYYAYWSGVSPHIAAIHPQPRRVVITFPTNNGLTVTYVAFPCCEFEEVRSDPERHLEGALRSVANLEEPFRGATRVERVKGTGDLRNFFRTAYGNGWALVGDAGYHKDPIIAQGISDAFRSAEWLVEAVHAGFSGKRPLKEALADYQRVRDEELAPMYELSCSLATLEPPSPEMLALYEALRTNSVERNRFFGTLGGAVSPSEYYAADNLQRIISGASA